MRIASLIVIALALASVSNQSFLSFGEFIEGHEPTTTSGRIFEITGGNMHSRFETLIKAKKWRPTIVVQDPNTVSIEGLCNSCTSSNGKAPVCTKKACDGDSNYLQEYITEIISNKKSASSYLWGKAFGTYNLVGEAPSGCNNCQTPYMTFKRVQ